MFFQLRKYKGLSEALNIKAVKEKVERKQRKVVDSAKFFFRVTLNYTVGRCYSNILLSAFPNRADNFRIISLRAKVLFKSLYELTIICKSLHIIRNYG